MQVIATVNLKGGAGKSTTAINLAVAFHRDGARTLLVDADDQGTARAWSGCSKPGAESVAVVGMDARNIQKDLPKVGAHYDVVIIDTPARMGSEARAAMLTANLVLIPIVPGPADVWALRETLREVQQAREWNTELEARLVLNMVDHTNLSGLVAEQLAEFDVGVLPTPIGHRVAFGEAMLAGQGVIDWDPTSTAADETRALFKMVRKLVADERPKRRAKPTSSRQPVATR